MIIIYKMVGNEMTHKNICLVLTDAINYFCSSGQSVLYISRNKMRVEVENKKISCKIIRI